MDSTVATFCASAMSNASAPPRGSSLTRSPSRTSTPRMQMLCSGGVSSNGFHSAMALMGLDPLRRGARADRAVQVRHLAAAQRFGAVQQRAGARVERHRGALLIVAERLDAEREDLVDLGGVEEVAGALGGDLRVV